jgi:hypothetical protein
MTPEAKDRIWGEQSEEAGRKITGLLLDVG